MEEYKINHIYIPKDYINPATPRYRKRELKFQYHKIYVDLVKRYKETNNLKKHYQSDNFPLPLNSFKIFLAFNNLWWLINKSLLTENEINIINKLGLVIRLADTRPVASYGVALRRV